MYLNLCSLPPHPNEMPSVSESPIWEIQCPLDLTSTKGLQRALCYADSLHEELCSLSPRAQHVDSNGPSWLVLQVPHWSLQFLCPCPPPAWHKAAHVGPIAKVCPPCRALGQEMFVTSRAWCLLSPFLHMQSGSTQTSQMTHKQQGFAHW